MTAVRELITRRACQRLKVARLSPILVPPPMPCAINASLSTARATSRSRSEPETCASRVWNTKASDSRKASTTPCRKRTKNAV